MGLLSRQKAQQKQLSAKSKKAHNALITPPHIRSALRKWCMASTERFSNHLKISVPTTLILAQVTATKSLGHAQMPPLRATADTPSVILLTFLSHMMYADDLGLTTNDP
eukprot:67373-Pelagomonas_calceolata.AAC.2